MSNNINKFNGTSYNFINNNSNNGVLSDIKYNRNKHNLSPLKQIFINSSNNNTSKNQYNKDDDGNGNG